MTEESKKAFDFAADLTKQLITLATGIVAIMITFITNDNYSNPNRWLLGFSWLIFGLSILAGIGALMTMTGTLQPKIPNPQNEPSIYTGNIRFLSGVQITLFLVAIVLASVFGLTNSRTAKKTDEAKSPCQIMIYNKVDSVFIKPGGIVYDTPVIARPPKKTQ